MHPPSCIFSSKFIKLNSKAETSLFFKEGICLYARPELHPFLLNPQKISESKDEKEKVEYVLNQFLHKVQSVCLTDWVGGGGGEEGEIHVTHT